MAVQPDEKKWSQVTPENAHDLPPEYYDKDLEPKNLRSTDVYEILVNYSKIPEDQVMQHVLEQRDEAWKVFPYPCIGKFTFLDCGLVKSSAYAEILERVKNGAKFMDIGCAFGQDIRKLMTDGAPPANLVGCDLSDDFWKVGQSFFKDAADCPIRFVTANVLEDANPLTQPAPEGVAGTIDIIHASFFFHLFSRPEQVEAAKRLVGVLRPAPGTMMLGRHLGNEKPQEGFKPIPHKDGRKTETAFKHNKESWRAMWDEVGQLTGTKWDVQSTEGPAPAEVATRVKWTLMQYWVVKRVE